MPAKWTFSSAFRQAFVFHMYVTVHWRFCFIFSFVAKKSNIQFMNWCKLFSGLHVRTKNNSWIGISFTEHSYFNFKAACNKVITWTLPLSWLDDCNYLWVTWIVCWVDLEELQCICAGPAEELCRACSGAVPDTPPLSALCQYGSSTVAVLHIIEAFSYLSAFPGLGQLFVLLC